MSLKTRYLIAVLLWCLPFTLRAQTAPVRLALQYWVRGDYPNYPNGGHYVPVLVDGHYEDETVWDEDAQEWVPTGNQIWVAEHYEDQWVDDYLADGLYGSRWNTTVGTFDNPTASNSGAYDPSVTNRGAVLSQFQVSDFIYFRPWGYAPSGNCNSFQFACYYPSGAPGPQLSWTGNTYGTYAQWLSAGSGVYRIDVKYQNATGGVQASGTVSYFVSVGVPIPPGFQAQPSPAAQSVSAGSTVTYSYSATGTVTATQWYFNGQPIAGATLPTLTLTNVQAANAGSYRVAITNAGGSTTSTSVTLTVVASPPTITSQPASRSVFTGPPTTFSVVAQGAAPLSYQWSKNGVAIGGATSATYTIASTSTSDAGTYTVAVTNGAGTVSSSAAVLTVTQSPPIRLGIQYWLPGDYPNYPNGGHYAPVWVPAHWDYEMGEIDPDLYAAWDGQDYDPLVDPDGGYHGQYESYYHSPTWYWVNGAYVDQWVEDYLSDGLYGSRWNTTAGTFGDPRTSTSAECNASAIDRGYLLGRYSNSLGLYFRGIAYAPGGNCSTFTTKLYRPDSSEWLSWSGAYIEGNGVGGNDGNWKIVIAYANATGTPLSSSAVTYKFESGTATADQVLTFDPINSRAVGETFTVSGSATSGLPISYSIVAGPATVSGSSVTTTAEGYITIRASQGGGTNLGLAWKAATPVDRTFLSRGQLQSITFPQISGHTFGDAPFSLAATASSGLPVAYVVTGPAAISGSVITLKGAGTITITAAQPGNAVYLPAPAVSRTFTVAKAAQTVTFGALANRTLGERPFTLSGSASSGLPVVYSVTNGPATVHGAVVSATGTGTITIVASQPGDANFSAATPVTQSFAVLADTTPPSVPGSLVSSSVTANSVKLTWTASTDNIGVAGYQIYRNGVLVGSAGSTSANIAGLTPQTSYQFAVKAVDAAGNASAAATVTVVTLQGAAADADGDGIPDTVEDLLGTNKNSAGTNDATDTLKLRIHRPE